MMGVMGYWRDAMMGVGDGKVGDDGMLDGGMVGLDRQPSGKV